MLGDESLSALVVMDNFKGQTTVKVQTKLEEENVHVVYLPPNVTALRRIYQQTSKKFLKA